MEWYQINYGWLATLVIHMFKKGRNSEISRHAIREPYNASAAEKKGRFEHFSPF